MKGITRQCKTRNQKKGEKGFTLIELLMAFMVMTILAAILSVMALGAFKAYAIAKEEMELLRNVTLTFELVRRDLVGSIYKDPATGSPISGVNFLGTDQTDAQGKANDKLQFFALLSPDSGARGDLTSINYKREEIGGVKRLSRASLGTGSSGLPPLVLDGVEPFEPLLFYVTAFDVQYLSSPTGSYQASYDASSAGQLPRAVRIRISVQVPGGKEKTFTYTVMLAMG